MALCIKGKNDHKAEYSKGLKKIEIKEGSKIPKNKWSTLFISGGRRDKISKGDIAGLFIKKGQLEGKELGVIELKTDCAFVAVARNKADSVCQKLNNERLKKKKVRIRVL
jgi:hypothetical protein